MNWFPLDYGFKVARWRGQGDIRAYRLKGWETTAELLEHDPVTGDPFVYAEWFVFARKKDAHRRGG